MKRLAGLRFKPGMAPIALAAVILLALQGLHGIDHLTLQDRPLEPQIAALGVLESAAVLLTLVLALRGRPEAAPAAFFAGGFTALAFAASNLLDRWGFLSDPYAEQSLGAVSWVVMFAGLVAALALAGTGIAALRSGAGKRVVADW